MIIATDAEKALKTPTPFIYDFQKTLVNIGIEVISN